MRENSVQWKIRGFHGKGLSKSGVLQMANSGVTKSEHSSIGRRHKVDLTGGRAREKTRKEAVNGRNPRANPKSGLAPRSRSRTRKASTNPGKEVQT